MGEEIHFENGRIVEQDVKLYSITLQLSSLNLDLGSGHTP